MTGSSVRRPSPSPSRPGAAPRAAADGRRGRAVIIGGSLAGMLAAAALSPYADEVVIVERDVLPTGPEGRRHLPQGRHGHILWSGGSEAMDALLPGTIDRWKAAGGRKIPLTQGMVSLSPRGWFRRWRPTHHIVACGRDRLDWVVREAALALPGVRLMEGTQVLGLEGDARRVTGVRVRAALGGAAEPSPAGTGATDGVDGGEARGGVTGTGGTGSGPAGAGPAAGERVLSADLVVDASGRGTRGPVWLGALGVPAVPVEEIDSGLVYASRLYRAPAGVGELPVVNIQAAARERRPGRTGTIIPIEDGQWIVTLSGTRGAQPTSDPDAFESFARELRHPLLADFLARAEPLGRVHTFANTANRRRRYERSRTMPEGFLSVGDAAVALNPVYGHGMSVAAQCAVALRDRVAARGLTAPGLAAEARRRMAGPISVAWDLATRQDVFFPGSTGRRPGPADVLIQRYVDRLMYTATGDFHVATALTDVMTLSKPASRLVRPRVLLHALRGPGLPPLSGPALTRVERDCLALPRADRPAPAPAQPDPAPGHRSPTPRPEADPDPVAGPA
ncbi:pyridine nucleotide-disulfide oxidoreductase [Streptomyces sp. NPDC093225]|uniref:pyridine nucleotide-disulfide oxidoreductase n=1 Tax=Streptomyces sp. NPDC093225 TaxID=3366034 RepID=UPI00382B8CA6